jgi:magnesium chelatase family protein
MLAKTFSATLRGMKPIKIEVEIDAVRGAPKLIIIGLPNKAIDEAKERITAALLNCDVRPKSKRTVINLAPANLKKSDNAIEFAIVVALLKLYHKVKIDTDESIFLGELSLDGSLKPITGALPLVIAAKEMGFKAVFLPHANLKEVNIIKDIKIYPVKHLRQFIAFASGEDGKAIKSARLRTFASQKQTYPLDFADIRGQQQAKRALEICAAGGHNLIMVGPPGAGKSLLAKTFPSILPPLTEQEAIEVTKIFSIAGLTSRQGLITTRPFRSPHHTISQAGLVGGGSNLKPGEISLAHRGVLFLDEIPEFSRTALEALRQPMEDGVVTIARAVGSARYPASFSLVAAANPCPCGYYGSKQKKCHCTPQAIERYRQRLSGPVLDRIDVKLQVDAVDIKALTTREKNQNETSAQIRQRVIEAKQHQLKRYQQTPYLTNSELLSKDVRRFCQLTNKANQLLTQATQTLALSARGYFKVIKVAQTIADLIGEQNIKAEFISEALQYR